MLKGLSKYFAFFYISLKQSLGNRTTHIGGCFFLLILLFIYNQLWSVIGIQNNEQHLTTNFIWYLLLAEMIILSPPRIERTLEYDIRSGNMAYYINKPVSFFGMRFSESLAEMTASFTIMGIVGGVIAYFLTGNIPFRWANLPLIIIMCYISSTINMLFFMAVGLCALWLESTKTLAMAFQRSAFILGGAIFPLSIYPQWFIDIAQWTPFYSIYYLTVKLIYDFSFANLFEIILKNTFWGIIIFSFIGFCYSKLYKKVNIYGG